MPTPYAYFQKEIIPLADAKIGIMTHAFNYGTGVFEGIRGNWNNDEEQIYVFRLKEHFARLRNSCKIMRIGFPYDNEELISITTKIVEMSGYREDVYLRPLAYKSSEVLGVRLHDLEDDFLIFIAPFGPYLDIEKGARCCTSSWRRVEDTSIPARAKITGIYANSALAKTEAQLNGYDEAIMLDERGHVSEGSGENIFMVMDGKIYTPPPSSNILIGITRETAIT
ncbi:MAG: aminotransferase class IV, partial [Chloroflexi bacterium]|nr:aminotransferase class IV [Chloroflexota bacterium]